jgi:hypothetical protein
MYKPAVPGEGEGKLFLAVSFSNEAIGTDAQPFKYAATTSVNKISIFLCIINSNSKIL